MEGDIPLVLAGPILRRVKADSVTVWLALREPAEIVLSVYDRDQLGSPPVPPLLRAGATTVAVGARLHILAITAGAQVPVLSPGRLYFYDLDNISAAGTLSLSLDPELTGQLTYGGFKLPSFSLPPANIDNLHILHGSCRKPHGEGVDALAIVDTILHETARGADQRPHYLFLTGDQIYADDVADVLLYMLRDASDALLGWGDLGLFESNLRGIPGGESVPADAPGGAQGARERAGLHDVRRP